MSTFYVNYGNGNDANDGLSWNNAWNTVYNGATAARIAAGDEVRIAKSPDPISIGNVQWFVNNHATTPSYNYVQASTDMAYLLDDCEVSAYWTNGLSTVSTTTGYFRVGTKSLSLSTNYTGKLAYRDFGGNIDLSAYRRLTLWVRFSANASWSGSTSPIQIRLCSDASGDTPVDTFTLPPTYFPGNRWVPITIDNGAACGSAIRSLSLFTTGSFNATMYIDNINITKAAGQTNSLCLNDVIGKGTDGSEGWFAVKGIFGTQIWTMALSHTVNTLPTTTQGRYNNPTENTETVATYKRELIPTHIVQPQSSTSGSVHLLNDQGTVSSPISFSGGWNTSTNTRDGESWFDGVTQMGHCVDFVNNYRYVDVDRIGAVRYTRGFSDPQYDVNITNCSGVDLEYQVLKANTSVGEYGAIGRDITWHFKCGNQCYGAAPLLFGATGKTFVAKNGYTATIKMDNVFQCATIAYLQSMQNVYVEFGKICHHDAVSGAVIGQMVQFSGINTVVRFTQPIKLKSTTGFQSGFLDTRAESVVDCVFVFDDVVNLGSNGTGDAAQAFFVQGQSSPSTMSGFRFEFNPNKTCKFASVVRHAAGGSNRCYTTSRESPMVVSNLNYTVSSTDVSQTLTWGDFYLVFENYNNVIGSHRAYHSGPGGVNYYQTQTTYRHTPSGVAWEICIASSSVMNNKLTLARAAVKANKLVTATVWVRRSATGGKCQLGVGRNPAIGITSETLSDITEPTANTWEEKTITFTPTEAGVFEFIANARYVSGLCSYYFDDVSITQAD